MQKSRASYCKKSYRSSRGFSILGVVVSMGILSLLLTGIFRTIHTGYQASNDLNQRQQTLEARSYVFSQISCKETVESIRKLSGGITANCSTDAPYIDLIGKDGGILIPATGRRRGQGFLRAKCVFNSSGNLPSGLDIRMASFNKNFTEIGGLKSKLSTFDGVPDDYSDANQGDNFAFKRDYMGNFLSWNHPKAKLFGDILNPSSPLPCGKELKTSIDQTVVNKLTPTTYNEIIGGIYQTRCKEDSITKKMQCRMSNNKDKSLGCACPAGHTQLRVSEFCGTQGPNASGQYWSWYCDGKGPYSSSQKVMENCGYVSYLCVSTAQINK